MNKTRDFIRSRVFKKKREYLSTWNKDFVSTDDVNLMRFLQMEDGYGNHCSTASKKLNINHEY